MHQITPVQLAERLAESEQGLPLLLDVPAAFFTALDERLAAQGYHPRSP